MESDLELNLSPRVMNIFYSDMFIVNGKGCLIMGHGKSHCGRLASNHNEVGQDHICLSRDNEHLYGHFEMTHMPPSFSPKPQKIVTLVRCLSKVETENMFGDNEREVMFANQNNFFQSCKFNICFTVDPLGMLQRELGERYLEYSNDDHRGNRFFNLISNNENLKYVVLPWMNDINEKAKMLKAYV